MYIRLPQHCRRFKLLKRQVTLSTRALHSFKMRRTLRGPIAPKPTRRPLSYTPKRLKTPTLAYLTSLASLSWYFRNVERFSIQLTIAPMTQASSSLRCNLRSYRARQQAMCKEKKMACHSKTKLPRRTMLKLSRTIQLESSRSIRSRILPILSRLQLAKQIFLHSTTEHLCSRINLVASGTKSSSAYHHQHMSPKFLVVQG